MASIHCKDADGEFLPSQTLTIDDFSRTLASPDYKSMVIVCGPEDAPEAFQEKILAQFPGVAIEIGPSWLRFSIPDQELTPKRKGK